MNVQIVERMIKTGLRPIRLITMLELIPEDTFVEIVDIADMGTGGQDVIYNGELTDFCRNGSMTEWNALDEAVGQVAPYEDPDTIGPMLRILIWKDECYRLNHQKDGREKG